MNKRKAFVGEGAHEKYERAGKFLLASIYGQKSARDWCDRKGVPVVKEAGENIGAGGAFLVPTEFERAILDIRDSYGAFRRRACVWPMGSDNSRFPRRTGTGSTAYFTSEGGTATTDTLTGDGVELTAKKLAAMVLLSSELDEDSIFDMVDYVANELAWAFAVKEDACAFNGDGTSSYGGIRGITSIANDGSHTVSKVTAASGHNTFATLTAADMAALTSQIRASAVPRAAWFVSATGFAQALVNEATGGYLETIITDGIETRYFNGFPVIMTQSLPLGTGSLSGQAMMVFGDMYAGAVLGQRRGITVARSADRYFDLDQIAILGTERIDIAVHDMGSNSVAGSIAVLFAP